LKKLNHYLKKSRQRFLILDFVDFLEKKIKEDENRGWSNFSLESAMRGMKDEETLYTLNDLKETFS